MDWKDQMPGGLADHRTPADFDAEQLLKGLEVEMEHTDDRKIALEIALDHLAENPRYYDALETIDPHDDDETDAEHDIYVTDPSVQRTKPRKRVFVEGDDLCSEVGTIADMLFARGSGQLGNEALEWLRGVHASKKNPYRAQKGIA